MEDKDVKEESVVLVNGNKRQFTIDHNNHSNDSIKLKSTTKFKMIIMRRLQRSRFLRRAPIFLALFLMLLSNNYSEASATNTNQQSKSKSSQVPPSSISPSLQQQSSSSQQANQHTSSVPQEPSPGINLIPVDQPITGERSKHLSTGDDTGRSSSLSDSSVDNNLFNSNLRQTNQHNTPSIAATESSTGSESTVGARNSLGSESVADLVQENVATISYNEAADSQAEERKYQQQQVEDYIQQAVYQIPEHQQFGNNYQQNKQPIQQQQQLQQQQPLVERRFGLLKKHYGAPMTANYATSGHYMSDCERCLFGLGAGQQQQSSDLQQIDPPQPIAPILPPAPPPPPPTIIPAPQPIQPSSNFGSQSFNPLKNKFFMKFPFFMKPISFGSAPEMSGPLYNFGSAETVPYWYQTNQHYQQHQQQPLVRPNAALFIRPAYNCIQATPPFISSVSNQHLSDVNTFSAHNTGHHSGSSSSTKGGNIGHTKQSFPFQQQQTTY